MPTPVPHPPPPFPPPPMRALIDFRARNGQLAARNADFLIATAAPPKRRGRRGKACNCCPGKSCTCPVTICVQGCGGGNIPGASVVVSSGGMFVAACTTDNKTGCCTICLAGGAGTYTIAVSAQGYNSSSASYSVACNGTVSITLTPVGATPPCYLFIITGCCGFGLPGAQLTINSGNYYADANGEVTWCSPGPGTYSWTVYGPPGCNRFVSQSGTITVANCSYIGNMIVVNLLPQAGYVCGFNGPYPVPTALHLTDSQYGTTTINYDIPSEFLGTKAGCAFPPHDYGFGACPGGTFTMSYQLFPAPGPGCAAFLFAGYPEAFCGQCAGGFFSWNAAVVPSDTAGVVPCANGNPVFGCPGNNGDFCVSSQTCTFINPLGLGQCPCDLTYTFAGNPPCPDPTTVCCGFAAPKPACPCAPWTNFGSGMLTITEP